MSIINRQKNIHNPKAKIIGKIRFRFQREKSNKNILHQKVHGAIHAINQMKIDDFILLLLVSILFEDIFLIDL